MTERPQEIINAAPGLARIAVAAWTRTATWTLSTSVRVGSRVVSAAVSGETPAQFFSETSASARDYARRALGLDEREAAAAAHEEEAATEDDLRRDATPSSLRDRGADLLRRSADVHASEETHPAYARILDELAPDEARVLRLLAEEGAQGAVDVRAGVLPMNIGSQLVAPGISMIGAKAGLRHPDRVHAYLNNLFRLGLVWFTREPLEDPLAYQVLEAQPEVIAALKRAGRGRTVRRSINLTAFGEDFCAMCLPITTAEFEALGARRQVPPL